MQATTRYPLIHLACSVVLCATSHLAPNEGPAGVISYASALLLFLINLPGLILMKSIVPYNLNHGRLEELQVIAGMTLATSGLMFIVLWLLKILFSKYPQSPRDAASRIHTSA